METVKLWSIKSILDVVVNYTTNEEKVRRWIWKKLIFVEFYLN